MVVLGEQHTAVDEEQRPLVLEHRHVAAHLTQPAERGAVPLVLAAAGDGARNGGYYGPTSMGGARGPVGDAAATDTATDPENGRRLWELSEDLLGIEFEI